MANQREMRVLLASIVPPHNDGGARILMYRHLVERAPFDLHVASNADFADNLLIHTKLKLPWLVEKVRKSRFGPRFKSQILDFQNFLWPRFGCSALERAIKEFRPDVVLTLAEPSVSHMALKAAKKRKIPFAAFFMDWFPIMEGHFGMACSRGALSRRFRRIYKECDLAFCVSDGMKQELGPHRNSHVLYPISGMKPVPAPATKLKNSKFQIVYVGSALGFYGRMLQSIVEPFRQSQDLQLTIVGPNSDWPAEILSNAEKSGICLGIKPPEEAAKFLAEADALLVVMSFEREHELFMRTSFNTKFADYTAFGKPIIFWAPDYAAPMDLARRPNATMVVNSQEPEALMAAVRKLAAYPHQIERLSDGSRSLREEVLDPERLQGIFVGEIEKLAICLSTKESSTWDVTGEMR
jgi:glycosyltransferase involved in cell wall biosynthesis